MRKSVIALACVLAAASTAAEAQYRHHQGYGYAPRHHHHHQRHHRGNQNWVAPLVGGLLIGGIIGSMAAPPAYAVPPTYCENVHIGFRWDPYYHQHVPVYRRMCQ